MHFIRPLTRLTLSARVSSSSNSKLEASPSRVRQAVNKLQTRESSQWSCQSPQLLTIESSKLNQLSERIQFFQSLCTENARISTTAAAIDDVFKIVQLVALSSFTLVLSLLCRYTQSSAIFSHCHQIYDVNSIDNTDSTSSTTQDDAAGRVREYRIR